MLKQYLLLQHTLVNIQRQSLGGFLNDMEYSFGKVEMDYVADVGGLSGEKLIEFYESLAHSLTVSVRSIWSDEALKDAERVEQMKWLNEIMHRVVTKSAALRMNRNEMSESDTWKMMEGYISQCPALAPHIASATISSYQSVVGFLVSGRGDR